MRRSRDDVICKLGQRRIVAKEATVFDERYSYRTVVFGGKTFSILVVVLLLLWAGGLG